MNSHPLDGARLKVIRAQEHVDALKAAIRMYLEEQPYAIVTEQNADQTFTTTITPTLAPPLRFSTIVGDVLTNTRAALDYVMFQLAQAHFVPALDLQKGPDRALSLFPLVASPDVDRFNRLTQRMTARPDAAAAIDQIQGSQPYHAGQAPMGWLRHLVNTDKHQMPLLMISGIETFRATFGASKVRYGRGSNGRIFFEESTKGEFSVTEHDLTAERVTLDSDDMQVDAQATVYVALHDVAMPREPADRVLEQIIECVAHLIPRFDGFVV